MIFSNDIEVKQELDELGLVPGTIIAHIARKEGNKYKITSKQYTVVNNSVRIRTKKMGHLEDYEKQYAYDFNVENCFIIKKANPKNKKINNFDTYEIF